MADGGNIKVVVRCRPLNSREKARGAKYLIDVTGPNSVVLNPPTGGDTKENARATKKKSMPFSFDRMFSEDTEQSELFAFVGEDVIEHAFAGYNTCVFAYGQTGSGKSHSMVGYAEQRGLIPLTCSRIFEDIAKQTTADPNLKCTVEVSYMEIYNEKVHDLLNPKNKGNLKVREHPSLGPYVEDLSRLLVNSYEDIDSLLDEGNKARTIASTNMNATSSRSHAVITLILTQKRHDVDTNLDTEKVSRVSLVDLAGSERANSTGATGDRLKEGANINRSLTTLGKVIAALAGEPIGAVPKKKGKKSALDFIPYRDSVLTWLLKDSLGGNSKTAMIAAISPADYEETLSTLRYADQAKKIKNKAVVNEDPNAKLIRELKEELELLRAQVGGDGGEGGGVGGGGAASISNLAAALNPNVPPEKQVITYQTKSGEVRTMTKKELQEQLEQSEKLMKSLDESWEDKMARTDAIHRERERALEELGISISHNIAQNNDVGLVHTPKSLPHLVNLNEDPLMSECLIYQLKTGKTVVGNAGHQASRSQEQGDGTEGTSGEEASAHKLSEVTIPLSGTNIQPLHCVFTNEGGKVTIQALPGAVTMVNGQRLEPSQTKRLRSGYRVILGDYHVFRFNHPEEVRKARDRVNSAKYKSVGFDADDGESYSSSESEDNNVEVDWTYARAEAALAKLNGEHVDFGKFDEAELEKLMEDVRRARIKKRGAGFPPDLNDASPSHLNSVPLEWAGDWDDGTPWGTRNGSESGSGVPSTSASLAQETQALRDRVRQYEQRLVEARDAASVYAPLTSEERKIARLALAHWHMSVPLRLAHDIQRGAPLVLRAMRAAVTAQKDVRYQLFILDREPSSAAPVLKQSANGSTGKQSNEANSIIGLEAPEDIDPDRALTLGPRPCVAVQVLDPQRSAIFVWSLTKLEAVIPQMESAAARVTAASSAVEYVNGGTSTSTTDPFTTQALVPLFSFIGVALVPLSPLSKGQSTTFGLVPFRNAQTNTLLGSCCVRLSIRGLVHPRGRKLQNDGNPLPLGARLALTIEVNDVAGLDSNDFVQAHLQVRRQSLTGELDSLQLSYAGDRGAHPLLTHSSADTAGANVSGSYAVASAISSVPAPVGQTKTWRNVRLRKTVDVLITPASVYHLTHGYLAVELFASPSQRYFSRLDALSESAGSNPPSMTRSSTALSTVDRDLQGTYHQDLVLRLEIHELGDSGDYEPVQVVPLGLPTTSNAQQKGSDSSNPTRKMDEAMAFFLRQGSQRKLVLSVQSEKRGRVSALRIAAVRVGDVCLIDHTGTMHKSSDDRLISLVQRPASSLNRPDGIVYLHSSARWDFTSHQTLFLDRLTRQGECTTLKVEVDVETDMRAPSGLSDASSYPHQITLTTTLPATVHPPDAAPSSSWRSWVGQSTGPVTAVTELFDIQLVPQAKMAPTSAAGLGEVNAVVLPAADGLISSNGEASPFPTRTWRPRSLSLLRDYADSTRRQVLRADVEATRVLLNSRLTRLPTPPPASPLHSPSPASKQDAPVPAPPQDPLEPTPLEDVWASSAPSSAAHDAVSDVGTDDPWAAPDPWQSQSSRPTSLGPVSTDAPSAHDTQPSTPPSPASADHASASDVPPSSSSVKPSRVPLSAEVVVSLWQSACQEAAYNRMEQFRSKRESSPPGSNGTTADAGPAIDPALLRPTVIINPISTTLASSVPGSRAPNSLGANRRSGWLRVCADPVQAASGTPRRRSTNSASEPDPWPRRWAVLFDSHLLLFTESNPRRRLLESAVCIDGDSHAEISSELGRLCQVSSVLSLYTSANSYLLLARNEADLHGWLFSIQATINDGTH